ncbi:ABC transporter permease [Pelagibius sp.]|uniref:cell division protein FtsX n=1 Tax=Pelagibius sp. TaxID=1931238 RepID=UPI002616F1D9|nr:FtsX-like permease family protein [Pelagibius sp.]
MSRGRRRQAVPLDHDASGRYLPLLVAIMVYLAALALAGAMVANKLAARWDRGLAGALTVQLPPAAAGSEDSADPVLQGVADLLTETEGVVSVEVMHTGAIAALLEPWLGDTALIGDLPLPRLIAVTVDPQAPPDLTALRRAVLAIAPGSLVDDHQRWLSHLLDLARAVEIMAAVVVALVVLAAAIMVAFVTRMGLAAHDQAIELLHLIGAQDSYVARQFQNHSLSLGLRGGLIGLLCALPTLYLARYLLERVQSDLLPDLSLRPYEWSLLVLLPVASALVTMVTARITVLRTLARLP